MGKSCTLQASMLSSIKRVRLRVGDQRLVKYLTDHPHWHELTVLATPGMKQATLEAKNGMVAVFTPDWESYTMSENARPLSDGLSVLGSSGTVRDVPSTDGIKIHSFNDGRGEPRVGKLQKYAQHWDQRFI